jgi:DNA mismatch repair protein MutL
MAGKIRVLDPDVVAKIAGGEVVERPASVVKELVENSLDAGARKITVEVEAGGRRLIRVSDDGCGMSQEDAVMAFQRHATSKIRTAEDLYRITTLGFRGEALPSIASVSHVELLTREHDSDVGTKVVVEGGVITQLSSVGCPAGTIVTVRNLFYNVPARLKFMRSPTSEFNYITELLIKFILANTNVSFTLRHDGKDVLCYSSEATGGELRSAVAVVWGSDTASELVPIELSTPKVHISGLTSKPSLTKSGRSHQVIIVNGRFIRHQGIALAITHAYQKMIPPNRHPVCVLRIDIDPQLVDVNVHPAKAEAKFANEAEIQRLVVEAIELALGRTIVVPTIALKPQPKPVKALRRAEDAFGKLLRSKLFIGTDQTTQAGLTASKAHETNTTGSVVTATAPEAKPSEKHVGMGISGGELFDWHELLFSLRPVAQLHKTYILAEAPNGVCIISQHRAHERIIYESLCQKETRAKAVQWLVTPITIDVGQAEVNFVVEHLEAFASVGFEIEHFGGGTLVVRSIPAVMMNQPYAQILRDIISELMLEQHMRTLEELIDALRASIACKSAIKAGEALSIAEMEQLLLDLGRTEKPFVCPHGQPVALTITDEELRRHFEH